MSCKIHGIRANCENGTRIQTTNDQTIPTQIPFLKNNENKRGWNATNYYIGILIPFHSDSWVRCCCCCCYWLSLSSVSQHAEIILTQMHTSIKAELAVKMQCNLWILTWAFLNRPRIRHLLRIHFALPLRLNLCW